MRFADAIAGACGGFIYGPGMLFAPMPRHVPTMPRTTYDVFMQRDGNYGVALSQRGAMLRTAPGFGSEADARARVTRDQRMAAADNPAAVPDPAPSHPL